MKKTLCIIVSMAFFAVAVQYAVAVGGKESGAPALRLSAPGVFPIMENKTTISIAAAVSPSVEDLETNSLTRWYEEKTNVHVDWIQIPVEQFKQKITVLLAGGDLPDAISNTAGFTKAELVLHGTEGLFVPLNRYINSNSKELKRIFKATPGLEASVTAPDRNIYALPNLSEAFHVKYRQKMWIYRPWLAGLGLEMPKTTEDFYNVLKAFKTRDPNTNGKADEIPLSGANVAGSKEATIHAFLMNSFVYTNTDDYLILENNRISFAPAKPEWRDGLRYLKKLYDEGLIYPGSFTQDRAQMRQLGENPDTVILGAGDGLYMGMFTVISPGGRWLDYAAVPPLTGPTGIRQAPVRSYPFVQLAMVVTRAAQHPDVVVQWADYFYSLEGTLFSFYGRWGEGLRQANAGEFGIDGKPAKWLNTVGWGATQNICWRGLVPCNSSAEQRLSQVASPQDLESVLFKETNEKYEPYGVYKTVPEMFFTDDQAVEISEIKTPLQDFVEEAVARFVTGDLNLDADWDSYLKEIDKIGLKRYLEIMQKVYDQSPYAAK